MVFGHFVKSCTSSERWVGESEGEGEIEKRRVLEGSRVWDQAVTSSMSVSPERDRMVRAARAMVSPDFYNFPA